jgi:hypothetical protein
MQELFAPSAQMLCLTPCPKAGACAKRPVNCQNNNSKINEAALEDLFAKIEREKYYDIAKSVCDAIGP